MFRLSHIASGAARPLDGARLAILRCSGAWGRFFVRRREERVALAGLVLVAATLGLTVAAPFWLLALGPVVWGIPHVFSDFRYLVIRPGLHRRLGLCLGAGIPLAVAGTGWHSVPCGLVAAVMAGLLARGAGWRKVLVLGAGTVLFWVSVRVGDLAALVFAHAHNFLALALWWAWRPAAGPFRHVVPLAFLVAAAALLWGWVAPAEGAVAWSPPGLPAEVHLGSLAPGLSEPWALRWVLLFAFAQAVHYGIWLRLIPEDDRPQPSPRTWAASFRALEKDFGTGLLWIAVILTAALAVWATLDLLAARTSYFRLVLFHGYLELAAVAWLFVEGRGGGEGRSPRGT